MKTAHPILRQAQVLRHLYSIHSDLPVMVTWYDFLIIAILLYTAYRGAKRGLVWQLAWIAALVLCFGFAEQFSVQLAPILSKNFPQVTPPLDRWLSMAILYLGFSFASFGVARVLRGWIEKAKFEEYDRHLGGIFGFVKGVVMSLVLTFFGITLSESLCETIMQSKSGYAAALIFEKLEPVMPQELAEVIEPHLQHSSHSDAPPPNGPSAETPFDDDETLFSDSEPTRRKEEPAAKTPGDRLWDLIAGDKEPNQPEPEQPLDLRRFLSELPATLTREMQEKAVRAFRDADPEQRRALFNQVRSALPGDLSNALSRFGSDNEPAETKRTPARPEIRIDTARRDRLMADIAMIYSDREESRSRFVASVKQKLEGVPGPVMVSLLTDWHADLTSAVDDPDPTTDFKTSFDVRLLKQLEANRVDIRRLSQALQDRMTEAARR